MAKREITTPKMAAVPLDHCNFSVPFTIIRLNFANSFHIKACIFGPSSLGMVMCVGAAVFVCLVYYEGSTLRAFFWSDCSDFSLSIFTFRRKTKISFKNYKRQWGNFYEAQKASKKKFLKLIDKVSPELINKLGISIPMLSISSTYLQVLPLLASFGNHQ